MSGAVLMALGSQARASTTLGETFTPSMSCGGDVSYLQTTSPGNTYRSPSAGVITSWSHLAGPGGGQMKLKVGRGSGATYAIVGESDLRTLATGALNTFAVRIPVQAGDFIGFYLLSPAVECGRVQPPGFAFYVKATDIAPGPPTPWSAQAQSFQFDLSAVLEPDADGDGYGDETQDGCATDAGTHGPCPPPPDVDPPETSITKGAPKKSDKNRASFKFRSDEAGSTFQCKLKGRGLDAAVKRFSPCNSPRKYKQLEPHKYKFFVVATDVAGNADPTPVKATFEIVG